MSMMQPNIILLKEGTDTSQGKPQIISNINACLAIVDTVSTTLGPRGMDKLIHDGRKATISNDGATIMKLLEVEHPAAKALVDIAKSQDAEVGDGTTSVVVLAGEFMKEAKVLLEDGVHPQIIIKGYRKGLQLALGKLASLSIQIDEQDPIKRRELLEKCAATPLNSKLIGGQKEMFSKMVVDAVSSLDEDLDINLVGIKKVMGGALEESMPVQGVAFKKTFSYAGFEQQPKSFSNPKIVILNLELELKAEKENAEIRLEDPSQYQSIVDAEWKIIYDKLDYIVQSGAQIILSKLAIGDLATQYFADRGLFCAGRVQEEDLIRVGKATGASIQTSVSDLVPGVLGTCATFEEIQIGNERYNIFKGCPKAKTFTIILRGGSEQFLEESERSLHDSIMIVRRTLKNNSIVGGGGAIEMELSKYLREESRKIADKSQLIINSFAKALEVIPRQIAENAGFDSTNILTKLRSEHNQIGAKWAGVDVENEGTCDTFEKYIWEPALVKRNALSAAIEATCLILSIDETVRNPKSQQPDANAFPGGVRGGRGGRGGRGRMGGRR